MLAKRIIPCLDVKNGRIVKGVNFVQLRDAGDPVEQARIYDAEGADELVFLDITATHESRKTVMEMVRAVADQVFIPFTVGGGINSVGDMRAILRSGADKISINSAAVRDPHLISAGASEFGSQAVVVAIDARRGYSPRSIPIGSEEERVGASLLSTGADGGPTWEVYVRGGRTATGLDAISWAKAAEEKGAGEILLTSMDGDGTGEGYDIDLLRAVSGAVSIPVIASGGAGRLQHFADALTIGGADAVLAATLFHYQQLSIGEVKRYLFAQGIPVRFQP